MLLVVLTAVSTMVVDTIRILQYEYYSRSSSSNATLERSSTGRTAEPTGSEYSVLLVVGAVKFERDLSSREMNTLGADSVPV